MAYQPSEHGINFYSFKSKVKVEELKTCPYCMHFLWVNIAGHALLRDEQLSQGIS